MAITTVDEIKFVDPGREKDFPPVVKTASFVRGGLNVQEALYCHGFPD